MQFDNDISLGAEMLMNPKKRGTSDIMSMKSYDSKSSKKSLDRLVKSVEKINKHSHSHSSHGSVKSVHKKKKHSVASSVSSDTSDESESLSSSSDASSSSASSHSFSTISSSSTSPKHAKMTAEEIMNMKREILYQFDRMEKKGVRVPKKFSLSSSLEEMKIEFDRFKLDREVDASVKFQRRMLMAITTGVEFMNNKFDPFDIRLDGWSESINEGLNDYDDIFEELHNKYKGKAKMPAELKLLFMIGGSAFMFHLTNTMFKSSSPGLEQMMKQNPDLMKQFTEATMNTMANNNNAKKASGGGGGLGNLVSGMFGGGSGGGLGNLMGSLFGMGGNEPPQPSNNTQVRPQMKGPTHVDDILREINNNNNMDRVDQVSNVSESEISEMSEIIGTKKKGKNAAGRTINL